MIKLLKRLQVNPLGCIETEEPEEKPTLQQDSKALKAVSDYICEFISEYHKHNEFADRINTLLSAPRVNHCKSLHITATTRPVVTEDGNARLKIVFDKITCKPIFMEYLNENNS